MTLHDGVVFIIMDLCFCMKLGGWFESNGSADLLSYAAISHCMRGGGFSSNAPRHVLLCETAR